VLGADRASVPRKLEDWLPVIPSEDHDSHTGSRWNGITMNGGALMVTERTAEKALERAAGSLHRYRPSVYHLACYARLWPVSGAPMTCYSMSDFVMGG
jgi:hypothetical protein